MKKKSDVLNLRNWLLLSRAEHAFMVVIAIIAAEFVVLKKLDLQYLNNALLFSIGPFLITLASFISNDYFDYESDKANRRAERPLVSGKVGKKQALAAFSALYLLGIAFSWLAGATAFLIAAAYALLSLIYSPFLKKTPFLGNLFIASSMSISFIYGNLALSGVINFYVLLFAGISFFAGLGREFLITLRDVKGDKEAGYKTFAMLVGSRKSAMLAGFFINLAIVLTLVPFLQIPLEKLIAYALFIIPADALFFATVIKSSLSQEEKALKKCRNYSLYGLAFGILAFAFLALT